MTGASQALLRGLEQDMVKLADKRPCSYLGAFRFEGAERSGKLRANHLCSQFLDKCS